MATVGTDFARRTVGKRWGEAKADHETTRNSLTLFGFPVGETGSLTQGVDTITGTTGVDIINAVPVGTIDAADTLTAYDSIDGGAGNDTLNIYNDGNNDTLNGATVKNVETININNSGEGAFTTGLGVVDASKFVGATAINQNGVAATVTNLAAGTTAGFNGIANGVHVTAAADAATATVALTNVAEGQAVVVDSTATGVLNSVTVTGTVADTNKDGTVASTAISVTGGKDVQSLTINSAVDAILSVGTNGKAVTSVDASASAGDITYAADSSVSSVKTGAGDDVVVLSTVLSSTAKSASVATGAGDDTLLVAATATPGVTGQTVAADAGEGDDIVNLNIDPNATYTVAAGAGDDIVNVNGTIKTTDKIDGGEGTDTISMAGKSSYVADDYIVLNKVLTNFEAIDFTTRANGFDASSASGYKTLEFASTAQADAGVAAAQAAATQAVAAADQAEADDAAAAAAQFALTAAHSKLDTDTAALSALTTHVTGKVAVDTTALNTAQSTLVTDTAALSDLTTPVTGKVAVDTTALNTAQSTLATDTAAVDTFQTLVDAFVAAINAYAAAPTNGLVQADLITAYSALIARITSPTPSAVVDLSGTDQAAKASNINNAAGTIRTDYTNEATALQNAVSAQQDVVANAQAKVDADTAAVAATQATVDADTAAVAAAQATVDADTAAVVALQAAVDPVTGSDTVAVATATNELNAARAVEDATDAIALRATADAAQLALANAQAAASDAVSVVTNVAADQTLVANGGLNASAKGYVADNGATQANEQVYAGTLNVTEKLSGTVQAHAETVNLTVEGGKADAVAATNAVLTGEAKSATVTLSAGTDTNGTDVTTDDAFVASSVTITNGTAAEGLKDLASLTLSGNGTATVTNAASAKLVTVDASGLNSVDVDGKAADGLTYSSINTAAETIKLGAGIDSVTLGASTYGAVDKVEGLNLVASATDAKALDVAQSDVLHVSAINGPVATFTTTQTDLDLALKDAAAYTVNGSAADNLVFQLGGNTYVYHDAAAIGGATGTIDANDTVVELAGQVNLDLLAASLAVA